MWKKIRRILMIVLAVIFIFCAGTVAVVQHQYQVAKRLYADASSQFTGTDAVPVSKPAASSSEKTEEDPGPMVSEVWEKDGIFRLKETAPKKVNFDDLLDVNGDVTGWIYCRIKKLNFAQILDTAFVGVVLAQSTGRWSNFVNMECFGGYTENLLAMRLNIAKVNSSMITQELLDKAVSVDGISYIQVHPTFLYESLWNLALFIILLLATKKKRFHGQIFLMYLMGYGVGRFWIEGLRTDQLKIGNTNIAISQVVSVVLCVTALVLYVIALKKAKEAEAILAEAEAAAAKELSGAVLDMIEADRKASEEAAAAEVLAQETMEDAAEKAESARSDMEEAANELLQAEADSAAAEAKTAEEQTDAGVSEEAEAAEEAGEKSNG